MPNNNTKSLSRVKFLSLPLGEKFRWQGNIYVKTSPLIARDESSGKAQMIQRAAQVEPLDAQAAARTAEAATISQAVLEQYHQVVVSGLDSLVSSLPAQMLAPLRQQIEKAFRTAHKKLANKT